MALSIHTSVTTSVDQYCNPFSYHPSHYYHRNTHPDEESTLSLLLEDGKHLELYLSFTLNKDFSGEYPEIDSAEYKSFATDIKTAVGELILSDYCYEFTTVNI